MSSIRAGSTFRRHLAFWGLSLLALGACASACSGDDTSTPGTGDAAADGAGEGADTGGFGDAASDGDRGDAGSGDASGDGGELEKPPFITYEKTTSYDGATDDLLTAGIGKSGLQSAVAPATSTPPTASELRRLAIYSNYRALVDATPEGGFGTLYGPNVDKDGNVTANEGKIAGDETIAYLDDGTGAINVTVVVQVPSTFDQANPCLVLATSSGSRGVYGAIATAGEWGLKHGCAVAYHDKGTGNGAHDLHGDVVVGIDGVRSPAAAAGAMASFVAKLTAAERAAYDTATPNRFAFKHAHSERNPDKDWGTFSLRALTYAFYVLNKQFGTPAAPAPITKERTTVIASSVSNGAGAALLAAEQDQDGLIDGVAVSEPQIVPPATTPAFAIQRGAAAPFTAHSKNLEDYLTYASLYEPCAILDASLAASPGLTLVDPTTAANRCASLAAKGLVAGADTASQAADALAKLHAYGYEADSDLLHASHFAVVNPPTALNYVLAHGRFSVKDRVCGYSYGATNTAADAGVPIGAPIALAAARGDLLFGLGNGIPPTGGVNIVNDLSLGADGGADPRLDGISISPSTGVKDFNLDGALCLRSLVTGADPVTGAALTGERLAQATRVQNGMKEVLASANLRGKPAIVVTGRSDTLVAINHASRAYFGANHVIEGASSGLSYVEVTNAQHLDTLIASVAGYGARFVPLHVYFTRAMDLMYAHLRTGAAIPKSQVVRTKPRGLADGGPAAAPIDATNVPPIASTPAAGDAITFQGGAVVVPD